MKRWVAVTFLGLVLATGVILYYTNRRIEREFPPFAGFLSRYELVSQSIEKAPAEVAADLPAARSVRAVYRVELEEILRQGRAAASADGFKEVDFPFPSWHVFGHPDGRIFAIIAGDTQKTGTARQPPHLTTVLYMRRGTWLEVWRDKLRL